MQRYYFHVTDGEHTFKDEVGTTFVAPEQAEGYAAVIASELAVTADWQDFSVVIENEEGIEIARVPVHCS